MVDSEREKFKVLYILPNLFTISALFAGFYAIVAATKGLFEIAAIALFIAMILDNLDGRVARLTKTQTAFGAELDSMSDMVAFGVAPALIVYHWSLMGLGKVGWLISFFYTATAALRLARFNTQINVVDKAFFKGLPAPVAAAVVAGLVWNCTEFEISGKMQLVSIICAMVTVSVAILMISSIRYYSFKTIHIGGRVPFLWALLVLLIFITIALEPAKVLFLACLIYTVSGLFTTIYKYKTRRLK